MGADVTLADGVLTVRGPEKLRGIDIDLHDVGELTPTVAALAALAEGTSHLRGIAHLRGHETDRLAALADEINKLGGSVTETDDGLTIVPAELHGGQWLSYADHRMATAGAIIGLVVDGVEVDDVGTTAKTLPASRTCGSTCSRVRRRHRRQASESAAVRRVRRPGTPRARSRPRTKTRPEHLSAESGMVVSKDRGRWGCVLGGDPDRLIVTMRARELGRTPIVVGDQVDIVGDLSGKTDTLARIVRVSERSTVLRRTADDTDPFERIVVANAEQLLIVVALADPPPRTGFVERALVAAYVGGLTPIVCLTKSDLEPPEEFASTFADLDIQVVVAGRDDPLDELTQILEHKLTA